MTEQVAMCCLAHGELARLFHEPHTGLDDCLRMQRACFRKRMSGQETPHHRLQRRRGREGGGGWQAGKQLKMVS